MPGEVARARDHRPGGQAQPGAHLARDDVRERRLAETRRAGQQDVVERLAAALRRRQEDREVLADLRLPDVLGEDCGRSCGSTATSSSSAVPARISLSISQAV